MWTRTVRMSGPLVNSSASCRPLYRLTPAAVALYRSASAMARDGKLKVAVRGEDILDNPMLNKGTAFTDHERQELGLRGKLPFCVDTLDMQLDRAYRQYQSRDTPIRKNTFLQSLKAQNWTLFYALLSRHLEEMFPVIYTPTEAEAISSFSHLFRRSEGLFISPPTQDKMEEDFLFATKGRELELIVVSDGEAILGIGDQGSGGIGISSAKAVIYTLAAGVDPSKALAVCLDVGTNNEELRADDLYLGWNHERIHGERYYDFVDKFVQLVIKHQPKCLLHFEDFGVTNAQTLLAKYKDKHPIFNDDIQGTGAVTLASLQAAIGVTKSKLSEQRIVVYGSGSAGLGIARQIRDAMVIQDGCSVEDAEAKFYLLDKHGLIKRSLGDKIRSEIDKGFVRSDDGWEDGETRLEDVVKRVKPTVLIGTSTHAGAFTESVIREMAKHVDRPIIFPLSNPTKLCECQPKDAHDWTGGKALIATGSPFEPVQMPNSDKKYTIAECNNALIYPGLGLGAILSSAKRMTDKMIIAGAQALAGLSPALEDPDHALLPPFGDSKAVNFEVALAVIDAAIDEGVSDLAVPKEERRAWAEKQAWTPEYREYVYDPKEGKEEC